MNILFAASQMNPFTGESEQGEFTRALSGELVQLGHHVRVALPLLSSIRRYWDELKPEIAIELTIPSGEINEKVIIYRTLLAESGIEFYLIENDQLFKKPDTEPKSGPGSDWQAEPLSWCWLSQALLAGFEDDDWTPDIIHLNGYQFGPVAAMLKQEDRQARYPKTASVLTILDLAEQGILATDQLSEWPQLTDILRQITGSAKRFDPRDSHACGDRINLLEAGIASADLIVTTSLTQARRIQSADDGCGLEDQLSERSSDLTGILSGADDLRWNPETDPLIPYNFGLSTLRLKKANKTRLLEAAHLPPDLSMPLIALNCPLTDEKGLDLIAGIADEFFDEARVRMIVLGSGRAEYEELVSDLARRHPDKVAVHFGDNEPLAHLIAAGADFALMPSRHATGNLNQLVCMRYGTVPIVYAEAGFADTVTAFLSGVGSGSGIVFRGYDPDSLLEALEMAAAVYQKRPVFKALMTRIMGLDFSWRGTALAYERVYERALGQKAYF